MANEGYPFGSLTFLTTQDQWRLLAGILQHDGVIGVPGGPDLQPSLNATTRQVILAVGAAWVRGVVRPPQAVNDVVAIPAASSQDRIDRVVMRYDHAATVAANIVRPTVLPGTPSATPSPPALTRSSSGFYDIPICQYRASSNGAVSQLVDERRFTGPGGGAVPALSTQPPAAEPGLVVTYVDTGDVVVGSGSGFQTIFSDSGLVALSLAGGNWVPSTAPATTLRARALNHVAHLSGRVERTVNQLAAGAQSPAVEFLVLPAALWPSQNRYWTQGIGDNGGNWGKFYVSAADGHVRMLWCLDVVPVGTQVALDTSWLL
jgi:hypothetical protein